MSIMRQQHNVALANVKHQNREEIDFHFGKNVSAILAGLNISDNSIFTFIYIALFSNGHSCKTALQKSG